MDPSLKKVAEVWERETAIVEGMDISGPWNRMFGQRVIWDYSPDLIEEIAQLPGAESFAWCYQCGKCVPVCPVDVVGDYGPRKLYRRAQTGINLLDSPDLWLCTTCANCLRVCPKLVDMVQIMPAAREHAMLTGRAIPAELQEALGEHRQIRKPTRPTGPQAGSVGEGCRRAGADPPPDPASG